ncbi:MAG TPA: hypothetical protein P5318_11125 [Candidatus Hydrogenedentes bacterium]|nr:hypothetical protein [Candidatus Hydrogenedentota bacterium]HRT20666.1 hypothetical protein [Candidatus Hydrogenedentota bacterium]HRT65702.1 hypothetical protein [Candidatus Hydrogenedentota bacterium]
MTAWIVAMLVCAAGLAQQSQGLVSQSELPPPDAAAAKAPQDAQAQSRTETPPANVPAQTTAAETRAEATPPAAAAPSVKTQTERKPAPGTRVAAFWFILPGK